MAFEMNFSGGSFSTNNKYANIGIDSAMAGGDLLEIGSTIGKGALAASTGGISIAVDAALKNLVGLDVFGEANKVLKYGLSSWGASNTPESIKADFNARVTPKIQETMSAMNSGNIGQTLSYVHNLLEFNYVHGLHGLNHHASAKSSKLAKQWVMDYSRELQKSVLESSINELKAVGVTVKKTTKKMDHETPRFFTEFPLWFHVPKGNKPDGHAYMFDFATYEVDFSKVVADIDKPKTKPPVDNPKTKPVVGKDEVYYDAENGVMIKPKKSQAGGGFLGIAVIGLILGMVFKKK